MPRQRTIVSFGLGLLLTLLGSAAGRAHQVPPWLPRYDLDVRLDVAGHQAVVHERVTWTNRHACQVHEIVFNVHSNYLIPDNEIGFLAKMLEILRLAPSDAMDFVGHACQIQKVTLAKRVELPFHYREDNQTALVVPLPQPLGPNQSITLDLDFVMHLPPKQGRWGQWKGVTFLVQWLPVVAFHDEHGWQPTPFVPWHQPFFNEAGCYTARVTAPTDQLLGCSLSVKACRDLGDGTRLVEFAPRCIRDFALACSARFKEFTADAGGVHVRVLAFPEHEWYARQMLQTACESIPVYSHWFGPFPYPEFTIVESYFGWNGNECGDLVLIDERVFAMPHIATGFVDQLVSHEICHQWWYNVVGTNGYCETWMDEGLVTYFSHRWMNQKRGKNNEMLSYPKGLGWLPNIHREDYRNYGLYGTLGRGEACAVVQKEMTGFGHLVNLMSMSYDKGSKIVNMIEERLGEAAFFDFFRRIWSKYYFRVFRVADLQRELEAYTGRSWDDFFKNWLYGPGFSDWSVEKVELAEVPMAERPTAVYVPPGQPGPGRGFLAALHKSAAACGGLCRATVFLCQKAEITEQTTLGISLDGSDTFQVRIPILPGTGQITLDNPPATVQWLADNRVRVDVTLPARPTQIMVDPDQILPDKNPCNNTWKPRVRCRVTPLYFLMDETDLTNAYDRWNFTLGPWFYAGTYSDPWFTRSDMFGLRAGLYRTACFSGGGYLAYRSDDRNVIAGVDAFLDHWPIPHAQLGFIAERSLTSWNGTDGNYDRGVIYGRYVFKYASSLYLPPMQYAEVYGSVVDHNLPQPDQPFPGGERFDHQTNAGVHYHMDYRTPYWDPEGGFLLDATYQTGIPIFGEKEPSNQWFGQLSYIKTLPHLHGPEALAPLFDWLAQTRLALRAYGAVGLPDKGEFFTLGGGQLFRGFDLEQRQGSLVWVTSVEWRVPLKKGLEWDCCDHVAGLRNVYAAAFYDAGNAYIRGHALGDTAHALGGGLRLDVAWFGLIERTTLRFDVAKTVNANTPWQFWFGLQHPF
jgi:hypothetical protein